MRANAAPTANSVVTDNAEIRREGGKEFVVTPVSMIVPGVLNGSKGALFYPQDRVSRNPREWDGVPVTLGHPSDPLTNAPLSASDPGVVDRLGMGVLRNSRFQGGKLRSEAWLDAEKTKRIAPSVYQAAVENRKVEVSTGLFTYEERNPGTFNGRSYTHVVRDYRPDHLAILTDQKGACSLSDGCGLNVHNADLTRNKEDGWVTLPSGTHIQLKDGEIAKGPDIGSKRGSGVDGKPQHEAYDEKHDYDKDSSWSKDMDRQLHGLLQGARGKTLKDAKGREHRIRDKGDLYEFFKAGGVLRNSETEFRMTNNQLQARNADVEEDDEECSCGGECEECKMKATSNACPCGGTCRVCFASNAHPEQGRCPDTGIYQPKRFKGKGKGEVQRAAVEGMTPPPGEDQANQVPASDITDEGQDVGATADGSQTNNESQSENHDRLVAGQLKGGVRMDRQQMIQTLATNCACYQGKHGAVLNSLTDEQLGDMLDAFGVRDAARSHFGDPALNAGAMPAALAKAKGAPVAAEEDPDEEEDDEDEAPVAAAPTPPVKNKCGSTMNQQAQPTINAEELKRLRRMALNWERHEQAVKQQLVDRLVGHVRDEQLKGRLTANHMKKSVDQLRDEVAAMPVANSDPYGEAVGIEVEVPTANFMGAGVGGFGYGPANNSYQPPQSGGVDVSEEFAAVYGN